MKFLVFTIICVVAGVHGVTVDINTSAAPDLADFGRRVKATLQDRYPYVANLLNSPTFRQVDRIHVYFDPNYNGVAEVSGNRIRASVNYYRRNKHDIGSMVHEMAHVVQQYRGGCPGWITEGLADWVRFWHFDKNQRPGKPGPGTHYTNAYRVSAYFLNWIESRYRRMIYYINKDCREGNYNDSMFRRLTGKTVDQLWNEMRRS